MYIMKSVIHRNLAQHGH